MKTGIDRFAIKGCQTSIRARQEQARRHAAELAPVIAELRAGDATTVQAITAALNAHGVPTT